MTSWCSRQKLHTLRRRRSKSGMGICQTSEGDVVGVDIAGHLRAGACRGRIRGALRGGASVLAAVEELHVVGVDLGLVALLTGLGVVPGARLHAALHVDQAALLEVLAAELGELAIALVPHHDVVVVGVLLPLTARVGPVAIGGEGEVADRGAARRVAQLRVAGEPSDQHDPVEGTGHGYSSSSSAISAGGASSSSSAASSAASSSPLGSAASVTGSPS